MHDEDLSQEDIERFSTDETGFCTHCGAEIWDSSPQCPKCGMWLEEGVSHRKPRIKVFYKYLTVAMLLVFFGMYLWSLRNLF